MKYHYLVSIIETVARVGHKIINRSGPNTMEEVVHILNQLLRDDVDPFTESELYQLINDQEHEGHYTFRAGFFIILITQHPAV